ncbi:hypothetical protein [Photobacterium lipolyticum]|uniref:Uncharacterized protein n=1 Tax=Photobacterium lipolyticum TaxID=266810 RepID=A0A2T3MZF7_9GAMM|nr:hypothetical protein [Photobacterium lipolyticum]PSW05332.1 hypothetical protein C9I89_08705 [Photobacterium lipolyticum]
MVKWIGLVLVLVVLSLTTSGVVSALLDLCAFMVLLVVVGKRAISQHDREKVINKPDATL